MWLLKNLWTYVISVAIRAFEGIQNSLVHDLLLALTSFGLWKLRTQLVNLLLKNGNLSCVGALSDPQLCVSMIELIFKKSWFLLIDLLLKIFEIAFLIWFELTSSVWASRSYCSRTHKIFGSWTTNSCRNTHSSSTEHILRFLLHDWNLKLYRSLAILCLLDASGWRNSSLFMRSAHFGFDP